MDNFFIIKGGLLQFKRSIPSPEFWTNYDFKTQIFGDELLIDHIVINFKNLNSFTKYVYDLGQVGGIVLDRAGIWPLDFCEELSDMPERMHMYFASVIVNKGIIVCTASIRRNDDFDLFYKKRSKLGIHHIALRTEDLSDSIQHWKDKEFHQMGPIAKSAGLQQIFLVNNFGQIIELIARNGTETYPFSCNNVKALKLSEHRSK